MNQAVVGCVLRKIGKDRASSPPMAIGMIGLLQMYYFRKKHRDKSMKSYF